MPTSQEMKAKLRKQKRVGSSASKKVSIPRLQKKKKRRKGYGQNALIVIISALYLSFAIICLSVRNVVIITELAVQNIMICYSTTKNLRNCLTTFAASII